MRNIAQFFETYQIDEESINHVLNINFRKSRLIKILLQYVVVKNLDLERNYPGGVLGFVLKYDAVFNQKLSVLNGWGLIMSIQVLELKYYGLLYPDDFIFGTTDSDWYYKEFDVYKYPPAHLEFGNDWLLGYHCDGEYFVYHI